MAVRVIARLLLLAAITFSAQWLLFQDVSIPATRWLKHLAEQEPTVFFIGDSTTFEMSRAAEPGKSIGHILDAALPGCGVAAIADVGYGPDMYAALLEYETSLAPSIELVVVPTNVRVFGPNWMHHPEAQFTYDRRVLALERSGLAPFHNPLRVLKALWSDPSGDLTSHPAIRRGMERIKTREREQSGGSVSSRTVLYETLHYDFSIDEGNPILESLLALRDAASTRRVRLLTYLTPTDFEYIRVHLGPEAAAAARDNVAQVLQYLEMNEIDVLDLTGLVPQREFFFFSGLADHLTAPGRARVAAVLANEIERRGLVRCRSRAQ